MAWTKASERAREEDRQFYDAWDSAILFTDDEAAEIWRSDSMSDRYKAAHRIRRDKLAPVIAARKAVLLRRAG